MKKRSIIISIILVIVLLITGTYAAWQIQTDKTDVDFSLNGLDAYIKYTKGSNIIDGELSNGNDYSEGISSSFILYKTSDDVSIRANISLKINDIGVNLKNDEALQYTLVKGTEVISSGSIKDSIENNVVNIPNQIDLTTNEEEYTVFIWLDTNKLTNDKILNENLEVEIVVEASSY